MREFQYYKVHGRIGNLNRSLYHIQMRKTASHSTLIGSIFYFQMAPLDDRGIDLAPDLHKENKVHIVIDRLVSHLAVRNLNPLHLK